MWKPSNVTASDTLDAYAHHGTPSSDFWGILATYPGSGYTQSFGLSHSKAEEALEELFKTRLVRLYHDQLRYMAISVVSDSNDVQK